MVDDDIDDDLLPDSGSQDGSDGRELLAHFGKRGLVVAVILVLGYFTRPLWHGLVYGIFFSPELLILGGGGILAALVLWFIPPDRLEGENGNGNGNNGSEESSTVFGDEESEVDLPFQGSDSQSRKLRVFGVIIALLFFVSILYSIPAGMFENRTLAEQTMNDAEGLEEFPQVNADNPRVVPRQVADITTRGSVSYRQHRLGTSDIARAEDGSLAWSYPIQPDGLRNMLVENQRGVFITEMTNMVDRDRTAADEDFAVGEGMLLHRSSDWNLKKTDYWAQYNDDAVEFSHDGRPYMYYPKTGHEWHLTPLPHTTPTWEGGALVHPDGTIEHLSPEEAQNHEILDGQRLYPLTLTRDEMDSLGYRNGIVNQLPVVGAHENEVEVAGLPDEVDNRQPFVIDLEGERMSYVTAMEPFGADSRGLDEVWFIDAETGEFRFFRTERQQTFTGPERAMGIARSEDARTNWGDNFVVMEPVPVTVNGELWWHLKVAPTDFTAVTRNVFVNARTEEAVEEVDDEGIRQFLAGELDPDELADVGEADGGQDGQQDSDGPGSPADDGDAEYVIVVTNEEGEVVDRIPVGPDQDHTIEVPDGGSAEINETDGN
ncbi:MAG: hypothetical protein V5A55_10230 [Halovenus sp.]